MSDFLCALCQSPIGASEETARCPECGTIYHRECHDENQGCGLYGCSRVPPPIAQAGVALPATVWGREMKPCPSCGKEIRAAALRCRHCQTVFTGIEPMTGGEFVEAQARQSRVARLRRTIVVMFFGGVFPCTAPLILIVCSALLVSNRSLVRRLPPVYRVLAILALSVSGLWVILGVVVLLFSKGPTL
jgi:hypothetical protein